MARGRGGRRGPMVSPMMEPPMPAVPPMMPPAIGPVQEAVQQMPYSYKGVTADDIIKYLGEVSQLTPEQMAVADVNQDGQITVGDASWILQMAEGLRDPNTLEGITQPAPPGPPPMMPPGLQPTGPPELLGEKIKAAIAGIPKGSVSPQPPMPVIGGQIGRLPFEELQPRPMGATDPVQAAVNTMPAGGGGPMFPGREPKFPGVPPIQIPEPVGPIAMPPAPPTMPPPPVGGGGRGGGPRGPRIPPGGGPTPEQQAQLQIDQEEWSTNPRRFMSEPYWMAPNWWENRPAPAEEMLPPGIPTQPDPLATVGAIEGPPIMEPPVITAPPTVPPPPVGRGGRDGRNGAGGRPPVMPPPPMEPPVITAPPTMPPPPGEPPMMPPTPVGTDPFVPPPPRHSEWGLDNRPMAFFDPNDPNWINMDSRDAYNWIMPDDPEWQRWNEGRDTPAPPTVPPPPVGTDPFIPQRPNDDPPPPPGWPADRPWPPLPSGCPSPKERIQLANNDWILAGELKVGDEVITSEEPQKVTRVQRLENRARCEVLFEDSDSIVSSYSHPYFVNSKGFVEVGDLKKGDIIGDLVVKDKKPFSDGPVISLSVDKAETYMLRGGTEENPVPALSHNKSLVEERPWTTPRDPQTVVVDPATPTVPPPPREEPRPPNWAVDRPWPPDDPWNGMCPSPKEHIQLANNDWILAGELKVGDEVITSEEPQKITRVQRVEGAPRCEVLFEEGDSIVSSYSHPYFVNSKGFVEVGNLESGDVIGDLVVKDKKPFSDGPVISLSVDKAETYMLRGGTEENPVPVLSHNKSVEPPYMPMPGDPGYEEWQAENDAKMAKYWTENTPQKGDPFWGPYQEWLSRQTPTPQPPTTPTTPTTPETPETTPVQGMTMEEMQKMIADMKAQEAERLAKEAEMAKNYMIPDERIGYNPYLSGQYQADPYGPGGVPDMGGITTIPVPQSLTGIGYANYNPRRKI